ncbi:DUF4397 domain-containing protein [Mucilaginibacter sp. 14171R-50]|uniref:DUF4397 domain-containing protein n=1 Tax=Mucilaginibacter sp. 14171R-50 TaxID=2703789 RepID=UPI00138DAE8E|nr:DUF4397 domain-containing protein [Mucilaginibacter sp. 14171R-50]QHS57782.1 DUF4397 domain-containing protein [Mucilaginibacter sp. 14171R-50]
MANKNKSGILLGLCLFITLGMVIPILASCGKTGVSASSGLNARLKIVNLSPDIQPFNLYAFYIRQSTAAYSYPNASDYFLINSIDTPLQIRTAQTVNGVSPTNLLSLGGSLKPNLPYTWFVTGLLSDSSLTSILTIDTGSTPGNGRGKIRFVNASPNSPALNLTANDTIAFKNVTYKGQTGFIELTAGSYNLNVSATRDPKTVLSGRPNFTIADGKLYTMYFYGLSNRADTATYGTNVILNTLPPGTKY